MQLNNWSVYYFDNDGQKRIIKRGLSYYKAVKLWQQENRRYSFCDYESN